MSELNLGEIIAFPKGVQRDAIHVAVAPVVAAESLSPGDHVNLDSSGRAVFAERGKGIGAVDPYLYGCAHAGETFWLFIYPKTVTGMRHEWQHPAFPSAESTATARKSESEVWMRKWAVEHILPDYYGEKTEDAAYAFAIRAGHENHIGAAEDARDYIDTEWWNHWTNITGEYGDREAYFSCSC